MTHEQRALLALHLTQGIGGSTLRSLLSYFGSASNVFEQGPQKLQKAPGIGRSISQAICAGSSSQKAALLEERCSNLGIEIITCHDDAYPSRLKEAVDAPLVLFRRGELNLNPPRMIAVVGTRRPTDYGLGFVKELLQGIQYHKPVIISGLAYGIDIRAHYVSLELGLDTVAVLASGLNIIYPSEHKRYIPSILESGCLLSEYPPDELPEPGKFPARNRVIAGLSDAVIVIEAAESGGALITARLANDYNREVFALPADVHRPSGKGTNGLIRDHEARIITRPQDIEDVLGWETNSDLPNKSPMGLPLPDDLQESSVIRLLQRSGEMYIDQISWQAEIPLNRLATVLLNLEFKGYVYSLPGKRYKLVNRHLHA